MDLKLKNNQSFSLGNSIANVIKTNCTTAFVKDCPNVSGMAILNQCTNLTRVRLDIGSVSASLGELLAFANLAGFNDNYEPQAKPRLVGTWTINDYYTSEQLAAAQAAFDGLTIVPDASKEFSFSELALQTLDEDEPNYNIGGSVFFANKNLGTFISIGKFFLKKSDIAAITSIPNSYASGVTSLTDSKGVGGVVGSSVPFDWFPIKYYMALTTIGVSAFGSCANLEFDISDLPSTIETISDAAFRLCSKITGYINLPNLTGSIAAFSYCSKIDGVEDLGNITSIGKECFYECSALKSVVLPSSLTSIGQGSFARCTSLKTINFPSSLTTIGQGAFTQCGNLEFDVGDLPVGITTLGSAAFRLCTKMTGVVNLPNLISGGSSFSYSAITGVNDLGSITSIEERGFDTCRSLTFVVIPATVTSIGYQAFSGCSALRNITIYATTPPSLGSSALPSTITNIYVPASSVENYKAAAGWSDFASKIQAIPSE